MSNVSSFSIPSFGVNMTVEMAALVKDYYTNRIKNATDELYFKEWLKERIRTGDGIQRRIKWKFPRVSFETFVYSPEYLGLGNRIYPEVVQMGNDIINGNFTEAVIVAGIGSGKSTLSEILECYCTHILLCMDNPYSYYDLIRDKPITLINMGISATQAEHVIFSGVKEFITNSPWFQRFTPKILAGSIRFQRNNLLLMSGNSKATTPLGYNIFYASLDEASFYLDNENNQNAEAIYTSMQRRITSRFRRDGLLMIISSPKYEGDFIMTKLRNSKGMEDIVYCRQIPTWKAKPLEVGKETDLFYFDSKSNLVLEAKPTNYGSIDKVTDKGFNEHANIWEIPKDFEKSFRQDPDKAKRDYGALPSSTLQAFLPHRDIVANIFTAEPSPVQSDGSYKFPTLPLRVDYYIHIDLAMNRHGKGDHAGFAMAHFDGWEVNPVTKESKKKVVVDLAEQIGAGPLGEIDLADIRNKIYALKAMGFHIKLVTLDRFASEDFIQILKKRNVTAEYLSVDRTVDPYQTLKEKIYEGSIKCHKMDVLFGELVQLELIKGVKVDHPPKGSKDVSDAVCGAVYNVVRHVSGGSPSMAVGNISKIQSGNATEMEKRAYYIELQRRLDAGEIRA